MSYEINWLIEDSIIIKRITGKISLTEAFETAEIIVDMVRKCDHTSVHILINLSEMTEIPSNIRDIVHNVKPALRNSRIGWVISYGQNSNFTNYLLAIITSLFKVHYRSFATPHQALNFLQSQDQNLPPLMIDDLVAVGRE